MARWYLTEAHYLKVSGVSAVDWEYKEADRETGRQVTKRFSVPLHLDPNNPLDHNDRANGLIIVCNGNNPMPRDIIFDGPPTPAMTPLDDEAKELSSKLSGEHPIESLNGNFSQSLLAGLEKQIDELIKKGPATAGFAKGVSQEQFDQLQTQVAELVKQNSALIALLTQNAQPTINTDTIAERRV